MSSAQVVLEAVRLTVDIKIPQLRQLIATNRDTLKLNLVLRILLTYLPESVEPSTYTGLLRDLLTNTWSSLDEIKLSPISASNYSANDAQRKVRKLRLLPLDYLLPTGNPADVFTAFLILRAHRINIETGFLPILQQLLEPFIQHSCYLRSWLLSVYLPFLRLNYEYYPNKLFATTLKIFERLQTQPAIDTLLSQATKSDNDQNSAKLDRDLRGLVGPWINGRAEKTWSKLSVTSQTISIDSPAGGEKFISNDGETTGSKWACVNQWLLSFSLKDFSKAAEGIDQWDGPMDVDYGGWDDERNEPENEEMREAVRRYAQTGLAIIYATIDASTTEFERTISIIKRVAQLANLHGLHDVNDSDSTPPLNDLSADYLSSISAAHLFPDNLLHNTNPLTRPNDQSLELAFLSSVSARVLDRLSYSAPIRDVLALGLFGDLTRHRDVLRKLLRSFKEINSKDNHAWVSLRQNLMWLRGGFREHDSWESRPINQKFGVLSQIPEGELEVEILRTLLNATRFDLAIHTYCQPDHVIIPQNQVEATVLEVALVLYDNASNGNKTRGQVQKASDIINTFQPYFPASQAFEQARKLILATHALSFYTLTLRRDVPFRPANIRVQADPSSLIDKILAQNPRSYTKLDDLLEVGQNLMNAGLISENKTKADPRVDSDEVQALTTKRRLTAKAIEAALIEDDFDTAYSYVVNRLWYPQLTYHSSEGNETKDNIIWRAAYQAGRFQSKSLNGQTKLRRLEQRMELLSQALLLAPLSSIAEVLSTWQHCEEDMEMLLVQELEEEQGWGESSDYKLPGGFTGHDRESTIHEPRALSRNNLNEDAPVGLFEVARGAAAALRKSAFPLRSLKSSQPGIRTSPRHERRDEGSLSVKEYPPPSGSDDGSRMRKRDVVSNMVTGGLASGIGWVLGAPPVRDE